MLSLQPSDNKTFSFAWLILKEEVWLFIEIIFDKICNTKLFPLYYAQEG